MPCTLGLSPTSQWGSLPLYVYRNKQSSALGYRTALAQGIAHPDSGVASHCICTKTNRAPRLATALRLRRGLLTPMLGARTYFPAGSGIPISTGSLSPQYQQVARTLSGQGGVLSARESFSSGMFHFPTSSLPWW
jgi:hypothetical protein